jgi:cytochrome c-type biogenesis protein CcmF
MISAFGYLTLSLSFLLALYGLLMVIWGLVKQSQTHIESARLALILIFPLVTVSLIAMLNLLVDDRFDVAYVYSVSSSTLPLYLKLTALWGGQSGSLLFWSWLLAGFSLAFSLRKWKAERDLLPFSLLVIFLVLGFFLFLNVFLETPFLRFWHLPDGGRVLSVFQPDGAWPLMPQEGQGLNPLLRHPGMIWHPPALYLGFVGFVIPFALAVATLAVGRDDRRWLEIARPWTLIAWVFLTLGLVLGMRWAYDVLGWGGYWGWDPVEIAALMPWLSGTAFLHTAILQRRKPGFKRWNLILIIITFLLVIFGTFLTRSGVLSSVHSFAGSDLGPVMFGFTAVMALGSLGLLVYRWGDHKSDYEPKFAFSRETLTLFSNLVLLSILGVCFLGVVYPIFSELLTGTTVTVGPAWYEAINGPLLILLLGLLGICPLAAWSGSRIGKRGKQLWIFLLLSLVAPFLAWLLGEIRGVFTLLLFWLVGFSILVLLVDYGAQAAGFQKKGLKIIEAILAPIRRNHRHYGGMMVHLGVILLSLGIIGLESLQQETQRTLALGEQVSLGRYTFRYDGLERYVDEEGQQVTQAVLAVAREGQPIGALYPSREVYLDMGLAVTQPALHSNLSRDLYAILVDGGESTQDQAIFRIFINPLVNWLWLGAGVLTLGTVVALWPGKVSNRSRLNFGRSNRAKTRE